MYILKVLTINNDNNQILLFHERISFKNFKTQL